MARVLSPAEIEGIRRILFIQTAFLGDVVFSTALLRACREVFRQATVTLLASPRGGGILEGDPDVEEIIYYDKTGSQRGPAGLSSIVGAVRKRKFDMVVSPHRSFRSAVIARLTGARYRVGFRRPWLLWAWNLGSPAEAREGRPYRRELLLLERVVGRSLTRRPTLHVAPGGRKDAERLFLDAGLKSGKPVVGLVCGTVWPTKKWPLTSFIELGRVIRDSGLAQVVLLGGEEDRLETEALAAEEGFASLTGKTSLKQLPAVLERCRVIVAADTGPLHAAMAVGVRVVALFGPTSELQFEFGEDDRCLAADMECRPCRPHGSRRCPEGDWRCMPGIAVEEAGRAVFALLDRHP